MKDEERSLQLIPIVVWKDKDIPTQKTREFVFLLDRATTFGKVRHVTYADTP